MDCSLSLSFSCPFPPFHMLCDLLSFSLLNATIFCLVCIIVKIIRYYILFCNGFPYRIDLRITESWWYSIIKVLDRITYYRECRNWTEYQLASASGLTQSTISSWYRKDLVPSIGSLEKICSAFGITLSQFFSEDESTSLYLTDTQKRLIEVSSKLTPRQQDALIDLLNTL